MASLDTRRPAAQEQLRQLGEQVKVATLPIIAGQSPVDIARRAVQAAKLGGHDVVILDTAGRTHIDEPLMAEMAEIKRVSSPHEILLVADCLTGQDAVNLAKSFDERVGITGLILTRMDGDGRGGAALSMRAVTGKPVKLIGTGEKMDALEEFHPKRIADRILGMGDIVSLVEKAAETIDAEKAAAMAKKMQSGKFDLNDLADQLGQMQKMGGMGGIMGMMPGMGKMKDQMAAAGLDDKMFGRQLAIISSMTKAERANPDLLKHQPQEAHRRRLRHRRRRDQQAAEDAPPDGRHDEGHGRQGQRRRHDARHDGRAGLEDGARRACRGWDGRHARPVEDGSEAARSLKKQAQAGAASAKGLPGGLPGFWAAAVCPGCRAA